VTAGDHAKANAIVSFGQWQTDPPLDRFPINVANDRTRNEHQLIPDEVKIKAGGAVNFIISGFHQILVYDEGTQPGDFNAMTTPTVSPQAQSTPPLINEPTNRIYRGLDPSLQPPYRMGMEFVQDRVEVVQFTKPGKYLVICGVHGHFFNDDMFGFVKVRPAEDDDD
jgi:plastocyanin